MIKEPFIDLMPDSPKNSTIENLSNIKLKLKNLIGNCAQISLSNQDLKK